MTLSTIIRRSSSYCNHSSSDGMTIPEHDYVVNLYDGLRLESTVYRIGGAGGTIVATVNYTYNANGDILTIAKS